MFDRIDLRTAKRGVDILPMEVAHIPEYFQKKAEQELNETPERIIQCTKQIRDMIKQDKQMKKYDFDDEWLLQYLRCRKFNVEKTFRMLKVSVSFVHKNPEAYSNYAFEETIRTINDKILTILPWRCHEGCAIILVELENWKPNRFPIEALKRMLTVFLLHGLKEPLTQVTGYKVIIDVEISSSFRYLRHCTPQNLLLLYQGCLEVSPCRFKGVHVVNDSLAFKTAWLVFKQFMSAKLRERVYFHSSKKTLLDYFPRDVIPAHFGGNLENYDMTAWLKNRMTPEALASMCGGCLEQMANEG